MRQHGFLLLEAKARCALPVDTGLKTDVDAPPWHKRSAGNLTTDRFLKKERNQNITPSRSAAGYGRCILTPNGDGKPVSLSRSDRYPARVGSEVMRGAA